MSGRAPGNAPPVPGDKPPPRHVPLPALWVALLGGPAAWSAHLLASYPLVSVACRMGTSAPLNVLTAIMALLAAAAAATGWWAWRSARADGAGGSESRVAFMGLGGLLLGVLFAFAILMEGLPPVLQDPCVKGL